MNKKDVTDRADIEKIIADFYVAMLQDPIVGFIFTDVAKIDLPSHLSVIVDFWSDIVLRESKSSTEPVAEKRYKGNALKKHLELNELIALKPGHFTRWLYLFENAITAGFRGPNANLMMKRAELVAQSISAAISDRKKGEMKLTLDSHGRSKL